MFTSDVLANQKEVEKAVGQLQTHAMKHEKQQHEKQTCHLNNNATILERSHFIIITQIVTHATVCHLVLSKGHNKCLIYTVSRTCWLWTFRFCCVTRILCILGVTTLQTALSSTSRWDCSCIFTCIFQGKKILFLRNIKHLQSPAQHAKIYIVATN